MKIETSASLLLTLTLCLPAFAGAQATARVPNLDHLTTPTLPAAAWSDHHSNIGVTWPREGEIGVQQLTTFVGWWGSSITERLLEWKVHESGRRLDVKLRSRNFRPDKIVEIDAIGDLELTATSAFPARNVVAVEFALRNPGTRTRTLDVSFDYPGVAPDWEGAFPIGLIASLDGAPQGSWTTLFQHREHGRNVYAVSQFVAGMIEGTPLELACIADLAKRQVRLEPGSESKFTVVMAFGRNRGVAQDGFNAATKLVKSGWTPAVETDRIERLIAASPPLPARRSGEADARMYAHAITALNSLFVYGDGGYFEGNRVPYTTKFGVAIPYFWDSMISSVGAREFNAALSQETIETFVRNATPRGSLPFTLADTHRAGEGQAPILAWALWKTYLRGRDRDWLARVYPAARTYLEFWLKHRSSRRGLLMFSNTGEIADNDARWDPAFRDRPITYGMSTPPLRGVESPDVNAFVFNEMKYLSLAAAELGFQDESREWQRRREKLGRLIVETMYFPDDAMFFDVKEGTRERFSGVKNPNMFLPLWAGVPLPEKEARRVIERHLLNPAEFFRPDMPVPSLSLDNPGFDPKGYWRGRIWPHINYWMIETLWRHGYHEQADQLADRMIALFKTTPWLQENYPGDPELIREMARTARPVETGQETRGIYSHSSSSPDFGWSAASLIGIILERYKEQDAP
jgi:hypothetical protein